MMLMTLSTFPSPEWVCTPVHRKLIIFIDS